MSQTTGIRDDADLPRKSTTTTANTTSTPEPRSALDRFFEITKRGSTVPQEIRGGVVTFFAMAYIVILNPIILSGGVDAVGNSLDFAQVGAVTGLTAGVMTLLMGFIARVPFALAAGLGINSFLAVSVVQGVTWPEAMGLVMINGVLIVLFGATGIRTAIFHAVPHALKAAITVGIGLFIAFIGFVDSGFVNRTPAGPPVQLGDGGSLSSVPTLIFIGTMVLMGVLIARRVPGAILIGIVAGTVVSIIVEGLLKLGPTVGSDGEVNPAGWHMTVPGVPTNWFSLPDFSLIGQFDLVGSFGRIGALAAIMLVFTLLFTNFFDAMGAMTGLAKQAGIANKDATFPRLRSAFVVEGAGAVVGGGTSSSSATVFIDSAAGIAEGARTGLASVITGALFLFSMFLTPLTAIVPIEVAAAALVIVGALMMAQIREINFNKFSVAMPAFLTIVTMPLTYSIANGIGAGFIAWALINTLAGRARKVHWLLWVVAAGFAIYFARGPIEALLSGSAG
ncbi:NCS2 family permease [Microbacterium sp. NPDC089321]|uniref:NCS2 family permease n=1 Tax=Microbacterium sp. NPDC089321 TaxID=3155183 RepID=UPI003412B6C5